ncbi:MAG: hypothetical protein L0J65_02295 [Alkalibacterium sp.]|uniref:Uncharacterized protein n=1 Tax=Alkalibacterium gilvum TaxID=1130080 RepID=A0A1H6SG34_9LACT|nr:hypothetical protein [Alkalibacterium gilvum]MDN6385570.1 hypothetical protein [Alkalibacterium sp.]SEI62382.1 hypothetical protein SAMN04488113_10610 [Alkalibacterium gilvum]
MDFFRSFLSFIIENLDVPAVILLSVSVVLLSAESSKQKKEIEKLNKKVEQLKSND